MPTVLIAGANRGIGIEFARQYPPTVGCRRHRPPRKRRARRARTSGSSSSTCATSTRSPLRRQLDSLDLLIANAGTYGPKTAMTARGRRGLAGDLRGQHRRALSARPVGASAWSSSAAASWSRSAPEMGSIEDNTSGGYIAYRSSKSALNSAWKSLAIDEPAGVDLRRRPPRLGPDPDGRRSAPLTPEDSVAGMRRVIEAARPRGSSGRFFGATDRDIAW